MFSKDVDIFTATCSHRQNSTTYALRKNVFALSDRVLDALLNDTSDNVRSGGKKLSVAVLQKYGTFACLPLYEH